MNYNYISYANVIYIHNTINVADGARSGNLTPSAPAVSSGMIGASGDHPEYDRMARKALITTIYCCCGTVRTVILTGKAAETVWYTLRFMHGDPNGPKNWTEYNERLVQRGSAAFSLYWIWRMDEELELMNRRKRGTPFLYPDSMIEWARNKHARERKDYRSLEGELREIMKFAGKKAISYSQMFKRCRRLDIMGASVKELDPAWVKMKNIENSKVPGAVPKNVAADTTGLKLTVRGEWMREKWRVHRGWIKLHSLSDIKNNTVLSYGVTTELTSDHATLLAAVDGAVARGHWIKCVYLDGAYDKVLIWNGLKSRGIGIVTNIMKNASTRSRKGCPQRALAVRIRNKIGDKMWKTIHRYGRRWKSESAFSDLKRVFGEELKARSFDSMVREVGAKIHVHNLNKAIVWGEQN